MTPKPAEAWTEDPGEAREPGSMRAAPARVGPTALVVAALLLGVAGGLLPLRPPEVREASAPAGDLSARRAFEDVAVLAAAPHPIGSQRQRELRDYLVGRLHDLGVDAHVQSATVLVPHSDRFLSAARVENVVGRLPGRAPERGAVLLLAHYDSVPNSPGAADDAAGVAALLETVRALRAAPPLAEDVIVLFTDGEEPGLFGAQAFVEQHPWLEAVRLVLNFEARGTGGPSLMFETGPGTGSAALRSFAAAAPHPLGSSYSTEVYRRMPNDSDFTRFRQAGVPGFNFAFIHGLDRYHSRLDEAASLDLGSLQHHGSYALALTRRFADRHPADLAGGGPAVYFNLPLAGLVVYPASWGRVVTAAALFAALAAIVLGLRRRRLAARRLALSLVALPLAALAAAAASLAVHRAAVVVGGLSPARIDSPWPYLAAFVALAVVVAAWCRLALARRVGRGGLWAAALMWWLLLAIATETSAPLAGYLVTWPLLLAALAAAVWFGGSAGGRRTWWAAAASALCLLVTLWLWTPLVYMVGIAFDVSAAMLVAVVVAILASLLLPQVPAPAVRRPHLALAVAAVLALTPVLWALAGSGFDAGRPRPNTLFYIADHGAGGAFWATFDDAADEWTERFLAGGSRRSIPDLFDRDEVSLLQAPAPEVPLPPPEVAVVEEERREGGGRRLVLRVRSPRGGSRMRLGLGSGGAPVRVSRIADRAVPPPSGSDPDHVEVRFHGVPEEGFEIEVTVGADPLQVTVTDRTYGLDGRQPGAPQLPGWVPRPPEMAPRPSTPTDFVEVRATVTL